MAIISDEEEVAGFIRETRDRPPSDYLFRIKFFSPLAEYDLEKIESSVFEAGGHKWRMVFFPNGCDEGYGDYISICLSLASKNSVAAGKEVNAIISLFLFDQIRGKYLSVQGNPKRFDMMKYEWGFSKFLSLKDFKEPTNGFLVDDTCFVGAEIYVIRSLGVLECMSVWNAHNVSCNYIWIITEFSKLAHDICYSDEFVVGSYNWRLCLSPRGGYFDEVDGSAAAVFLELVGSSSSTFDEQVKARYAVRLNDQINKEHRTIEATSWFDASSSVRGWGSFIQVKDLKDSSKGYIVNDCCIFEVEVTLLCETYHKSLDSLHLSSLSC